jgi:hypothetical protein
MVERASDLIRAQAMSAVHGPGEHGTTESTHLT